jgi:hypothetical protein
VSLCAPFLAFDPVMQFLLPVRDSASRFTPSTRVVSIS